MKLYTDYPILELGDESGKEAPVRECKPISYDGNKYCVVEVGGVLTSFKSGYIYTKPTRNCKDVLPLSQLKKHVGFYG